MIYFLMRQKYKTVSAIFFMTFSLHAFSWTYHLHVYNHTNYPAHITASTNIDGGHGGVEPQVSDIPVNKEQELDLNTKFQWRSMKYQATGRITVSGKVFNNKLQKAIPYSCNFNYNGEHEIDALNRVYVSPVTDSAQQWEICNNMPVVRNSKSRCQGHQDCIYLRGQSWQGRALSLQSQMSDYQPLNMGQWVGTHNSTISAQYSASVTKTPFPNLSYSDPNQYLNITQQLNDGVRFFEFDLRWFSGRPTLCHFHLDKTGAFEQFVCGGNSELVSALWEINYWLVNHPRQLVWIYLDMGMTLNAGEVKSLTSLFVNTIKSPLDSHQSAVLTKQDLQQHGYAGQLPLGDASFTQYFIVDTMKKNIIVVTHTDDTDSAFNQSPVVFSNSFLYKGSLTSQLPNDHSIDSCRDKQCQSSGAVFSDVLHHTLWGIRGDQTSLSGSSESAITLNDIKNFFNNKFAVNVVAFDKLKATALDPRLSQLIWSWGVGYPLVHGDPNGVDYAYIDPLSKKIINARPSKVIVKYLCFNAPEKSWRIMSVCSNGWQFATPVDRQMMKDVSQLVTNQTGPVLINYKRVLSYFGNSGVWMWQANDKRSL